MAQKSIQFHQRTLNISYEIINPDAKMTIVFLHGWGSNKALMKQAFGSHLPNFRHVYVDLPGFGQSTCNLALTTDDYETIMERFLVQINAMQETIIVGHSFGGKVAVLLDPSLLVLLSSAGIVTEKPLDVKLKIMTFKLFKRLGLSKLRSYFVANDGKGLSEPMYQTFKNVVNEDFTEHFRNFKGKALLCWGKSDTATPLSSGKAIAALISDARLVEYEGDHYFFMQHAKEVSEQIEQLLLASVEHR